MARKRDVASEVVAFFETSSIDTAETVLGIVKGIVERRKPAPKKSRAPRPTTTATDTGSVNKG
jgi:hypothetical protein